MLQAVYVVCKYCTEYWEKHATLTKCLPVWVTSGKCKSHHCMLEW
jgi:hypothetical protein